jgi:hypothetical protein
VDFDLQIAFVSEEFDDVTLLEDPTLSLLAEMDRDNRHVI